MSSLSPESIDGNLILHAAGRIASSGHFSRRNGKSTAIQMLDEVARCAGDGCVIAMDNHSRIADALSVLHSYGYLTRTRDTSGTPPLYFYRLTPLGAHCHLLLTIQPQSGKTPLETVYLLRDARKQEAIKA